MAEAAALESVAALLGDLPLTLRMAGALVREHGVSFSNLAAALSEDRVIEILDAEGCPPDDYRVNVDRALRGLIGECLASVPQHRADWLETLKAMAMLPENAIVRMDFLRNFCGTWADGVLLRDPYQLALRELFKRNLMEHPDQESATIRLHPLIHEHFHRELDQTFVYGAMRRATDRLLSTDHLASLSAEAAISLGRALESLPEAAGHLGTLEKIIARQAHLLAGGLGVLNQLHLQAALDGQIEVAARLERAARPPRIRLRWSTSTTDPAQLRFLKGHKDWIVYCAFSPDGERALSASDDQTLILWDLKAGEPIKILKGHENWVRSCAFSPDGQRAVSASDDRTLILSDLQAGEPIKTLKGHENWVRSCAFSPDGERALSASYDRTLIFWDLQAGEPIVRLALHGLTAANLSVNGHIVLIGDGLGNISLLEIVEP